MTAPVGFTDFFVLEASEYVEQLDTLVLRAGSTGPDGDAMQRTARALRGAATMAKLPAFAELAAAMEGIGRAMRDGVVAWDAAIRGAVIAAIDDLKILIRAVRTWSDADSLRASGRARELAAYAPSARSPATGPRQDAHAFLVGESNNIAAGLELLATRPDDRAAATIVLARVRALRGIAGVKDVPRLAEVAEAAENAARTLELGEPRLSLERVELLRTAAGLLRRVAIALRDGAVADAPSDEYERFLAAADTLEGSSEGANRIVPIGTLFYGDGGPHVVSAASNPPTTPAQRFRLEMVSLGEHFRRIVGDARAAVDPSARDRARRDLRRDLRTIREAAESFAERRVADLAAEQTEAVSALDAAALASLEQFAIAIAAPTDQRPSRPSYTPSSAPTPVVSPAITAPRRATPRPSPSGAGALAAPSALDEGIARLDAFTAEPFVAPARIEEQLVPVEALFYRGRAAVLRAIALRDHIRARGTAPEPEALDEIFELLDLALAE
jgi:chemotaxis protein histidine kinase CheA